MSSVHIDYQIICDSLAYVPSEAEVSLWVSMALDTSLNAYVESEEVTAGVRSDSAELQFEICIRVVDEEESAALNSAWRNRDNPTNVLSFPADLPCDITPKHLGDVVVCAPIVAREAKNQSKAEVDHWAHMLIHGVLHLLGYDHEEDAEAIDMEFTEVRILALLGISNPYDLPAGEEVRTQ